MTPERLAEIRDLNVDSCSGDARYNPDVWALEYARMDLLAEVDRLSSERDKAKDAAKHMGRAIDVVALEIRRAVRLANAGDLAAAMEVVTDFASEADWLDNLDDEDSFDRPSAPTVEQDRHSGGGA